MIEIYGSFVILLTGSVILTAGKARELSSRHGFRKVAGRLITGRPHEGPRRTDATFWHDSAERSRGNPAARRAGWKNLLIALGIMVCTVAAGYGLLRAFTVTITCMSAVLAWIGGSAIVSLIRAARRRKRYDDNAERRVRV